MRKHYFAVGFDDIRMATDYSDILPYEVDLNSQFSRNIKLHTPIVSSPMDTVTEVKMAIAMAMNGGLGIIHRGMNPLDQAAQVAKVKHRLNAYISDPICVFAQDKVGDILRMKEAKDYGFSSFMVIDGNRRLIGVVTSNDFAFCDNPGERVIGDIMSSDLITTEFIDVGEAYQKMQQRHKKILPVVDKDGKLSGLYTWTDVKRIKHNNAAGYNLDKNGNLLVGAAVGVGVDDEERAHLLASKGVDVFVVDTAHGNSKRVFDMIKYLKLNYPEIDVVAGNISEGPAAKRLVNAGADGIRVGQGPGSICTTRIISGIGHPQVSAIYECARAIRGSGVPVCGDGGIRNSGDIAVAIAAGANNVMLGNLLASTIEAPGEVIYIDGQGFKEYRGMGSLSAMIENKTSLERYGQVVDINSQKMVPEGVEGVVPYKGKVEEVLYQLFGGLRSGMGYNGVKNISLFQKNVNFHFISAGGMKESHPHDLYHIKASPNYKV